MEYLKEHVEISDVLADGFAHIYHNRPQFPITYLAHFLKGHSHLQRQTSALAHTLAHHAALGKQITALEVEQTHRQKHVSDAAHMEQEREEGFAFRIKEAFSHQDILGQFCEWIEKQKHLTGVYVGELEQATKKLDLLKEDSEEAHIDTEAPKLVKFKASSHSHHKIIVGKHLPLQSVVGKLLIDKPEEAVQGDEAGEEKKKKSSDLYIPFVQQNKELFFFKYPRLGSFYAVPMRVKSYTSEKLFEANLAKFEVYKKLHEDFQKEQEEREAKLKTIYEERSSAGAEQKELQQLEATFEKETAELMKHKLEEYDGVVRTFVVCCDTLGLDKQISPQVQQYFQSYVQLLRQSWEKKEREILQEDIHAHLKIIADNIENPQGQLYSKLIQEEDKELPSNQEVQKVKTNEKLMELEINALRVQRIKEYLTDEKYAPFLQSLLQKNILRFPEIIKHLLYFMGYGKQEVTFKGTNVLHWQKAKKILSREIILEKVTHYSAKGNKTQGVKPEALWERTLRNLQKYDQQIVAADNIYMGFILRFLMTVARVRIADNQARKNNVRIEREQREERIKEAEVKKQEREDKINASRLEHEGKEEEYDEEAFIKSYDEEHPIQQIGEQPKNIFDTDLEIDVLAQKPE